MVEAQSIPLHDVVGQPLLRRHGEDLLEELRVAARQHELADVLDQTAHEDGLRFGLARDLGDQLRRHGRPHAGRQDQPGHERAHLAQHRHHDRRADVDFLVELAQFDAGLKCQDHPREQGNHRDDAEALDPENEHLHDDFPPRPSCKHEAY